MRKLLFQMIMLLVIPGSIIELKSQAVYTIRPDSVSGKDASVFSHPPTTSYAQSTGSDYNTNFGSSNQLAAMDWTFMSTPGLKRTFLEFDLSTLMNSGCSALNATLVLPHSGVSVNYNCGMYSTMLNCNDNSIVLNRVTQAWNENTITWNNQPSVSTSNYGTDYVSVPDESGAYATYYIDITQMVNGWLNSSYPNYGMSLRFQTENQYYKRSCWGSSENSDSTKRPYLVITMGACSLYDNLLSGTVYNDANSNCTQDPGDNGLHNWIVKASPGPFYTNTDINGNYSMNVPPGNYLIQQFNPNSNIWSEVCPSPNYSHAVTVNPGDTLGNLDFAVHASVNCPQLWVDIGAGNLRPCHQEAYYVLYCNNGNDTAQGVTVSITLDSALTYNSASIPLTSQNGNTYTFNIGTLVPGQCGTFNFSATVSCSAQIGQTKCVTALIGPNDPCTEPIDSTWDRSSVSVEGECDDSLACFTITNTGNSVNGNMTDTSQFRIYENGVLVYSGTFQLAGGADTTICWPTNGNTIQLQADQRPGHPGNSHPNAYVENCGTNQTIAPVYGIINSTSPDDEDDHVEIDCQEVILSWDPNDKTVVPGGLGVDHFISAEDELEYRIRFQNTGNDTAFNIIIRDTLSSFLDPATVVSGASSDSYVFHMFGNGILEWTFSNILLPDSTTDEPGSHGFVKFKVKQKPNNSPGTRIENRVGIIFDINVPVMTNTAFNTIWQDKTVTIHENTNHNLEVVVFPNPSEDIVNFQLIGKQNLKWNVKIFDASGRAIYVQEKNAAENNTSFNFSGLAKGVYFYRITDDDQKASVGKIVIQ